MHAVYILPVFFVFKIPWTVSTSVHINVYHFSSCIMFDCIGIFIYLSDDNWVMSNFCYYIQCWNELHYACVKSLCTYRTVSVEQIPTSENVLSLEVTDVHFPFTSTYPSVKTWCENLGWSFILPREKCTFPILGLLLARPQL